MKSIHHIAQTAVLVAVFCAPMIYGALADADRELQEAQEVTAAQHSRDFAARQVCGENAAWRWFSEFELQCFQHDGRKTGGRVLVAGGAR